MSSLILFLLSLVITAPADTKEVCISQEERELHKILNQYRKGKGLSEINLSASLIQVAQAHAKDLEENYELDKNDCNPHSWSGKGKWKKCCYTSDHANPDCMWEKPREIAGYDSEGYEIAFYSSDGAEADEALNGWKKSKSHNPVMINSGIWEQVEWKAVGVGIYGKWAVVWFGALEDPSTVDICK